MNKKDNNDLIIEEYHNNRVAYFDSWIKAWIENRMELDKQLLTLSAFAIGLLISVFSQPNSTIEFFIWILAGLAFAFCVIINLIIFHQNTKYIEILLQEHQAEEDKKVSLGEREQQKTQFLSKLTFTSFILFIAGAILTIILAIMGSGFILIKEM